MHDHKTGSVSGSKAGISMGHEAVPSEPTSAKTFVSTLCALVFGRPHAIKNLPTLPKEEP
jgi:hypothetical protein